MQPGRINWLGTEKIQKFLEILVFQLQMGHKFLNVAKKYKGRTRTHSIDRR